MKFTNGHWLTREGFTLHRPAMVYETEQTDDALTLFLPCKQIQHRGDTLDGPLLTVRLTSPRPNVIRVQVWHYKGGVRRQPSFPLIDTKTSVYLHDNEEEIRFTSGDLSARINKEEWSLAFFNGDECLTVSEPRSLAYVTTDTGETYIREQLSISVGETIYGMGERFTPFVKNGQTVDIWNEDGGTSTEQSYKNIPFYLTNRGYGVFVNHPERVSFELASEIVSKAQFSVEGEYLDYFMINGPSPKEVLERYTDLTGKPSLPPAWSFGLWLTTSFTTEYDEETVNRFVDGMNERDLPLSVFHFDCFWMKAFEWCNFDWDRQQFPDPEGMLKRLKEKGLKISVWINPYIAQKSPLFAEAVEKGYLLKKADGEVWQWDRWQAGMGIVDFTNPEACTWFKQKLARLIEMGVDSFKTDFGERIPTDVVYFDGSDPEKMHNYYAFLYNQIVFELLEEKLGRQQAVVFARSATAGAQRFPVHWGGDCFANYDSMAESLRGGLSLALSGFGFWSHDIGGFESTATADLYKRWTAFGLLSSHSRLHGSESYRVPWLFGEEAVEVMRHFLKWKHRLMPYLFATAVKAAQTGIPMMRPMVLEFPDDPACDYLDRQYMLGESLLVAPVFREDGQVSYYLPSGTWTHLFSGEKVEGGCWREEQYDYMSLPLFVRANCILPLGRDDRSPCYDYANGVTFHLFELEEGKWSDSLLYDSSGNLESKVRFYREGRQITVLPEGVTKPWNLVLHGYDSVTAVQNGEGEKGEQGVCIIPEDFKKEVVITL
ncbi:alpha-xylosidase [Desmospora activa]|uniref:alpha-D-xyloside xylohydrolase n=1 Tax=Desmospora activa DSM 45169 TaxID=1121389 RepID=A0A2T4ZC86_9BACL|nr:alpha-xylosidase [Desmospora activa]PTM59507.1 alpha-D-xyloside xylohydrolase [Desmospora activa DSM 45169]